MYSFTLQRLSQVRRKTCSINRIRVLFHQKCAKLSNYVTVSTDTKLCRFARRTRGSIEYVSVSAKLCVPMNMIGRH
ncbi:hypothetical protein SFRURICE_001420 [Spodoptera frugiperda]|nr:hypothetical protein SFRURICE_001420 [Spodoptera frugiperda]